MDNGKIKFLHILKDDKFALPLIERYQSQTNIESEFVYYGSSDKLNFIKGIDDVEIIESATDFLDKLKTGVYNVIYFHSLQLRLYRFVKSIPQSKIVIWWAYGYDIYGDLKYGPKSFVNEALFCPETRKVLSQYLPFSIAIKRWIFKLYKESILRLYKKDILNRIDFFQPVLPCEFSLMENLFKREVKEYYLPQPGVCNDFTYLPKSESGNIIIGNSASAINNHVDIWMRIKDYIPKDREIVLPLSYGDMNYAKVIKEKMVGEHSIRFLDAFLPRDEYFSTIKNCSYAVYGSIRQHAMGSIYASLRGGVKVFLYRDSIIYKYLYSSGFVVFAIEDVDERSFYVPLNMAQQKKNFEALEKECEYRNQKGALAFDEIKKRINP